MDSLIEDLEEIVELVSYCRRLGPALSVELAQQHFDQLSALALAAADEARHYQFVLAAEGKDATE